MTTTAPRDSRRSGARPGSLQRIADAGAAVPIADQCAAAESACSRRLRRSARVTRVSRVPKVNTSTLGAACDQRMREFDVVVGAPLHRAGDVDQQQHLARARAPLQAPEPQHLAVVAHDCRARCGADRPGPRRARMRRWPRRRGSRAGPRARDAQGIAARACRKAAFDQRFRAGCGKSGLVGFVDQQRFVFAAAFLLQANDFLVFRAALVDRFAADEMDVEQPVVGRAPLRRWSERRPPREADVLMLRGPSSSIAARNAVVCSGATAKPLTRSSAAKDAEGAGGRGSRSSVSCGASAMMRVEPSTRYR